MLDKNIIYKFLKYFLTYTHLFDCFIISGVILSYFIEETMAHKMLSLDSNYKKVNS